MRNKEGYKNEFYFYPPCLKCEAPYRRNECIIIRNFLIFPSIHFISRASLQASPFSKAFAPEQHSIYDRLWHNFHMESVSLLPHLHHRQRHRAFVHLACVTWEMKYLTGRRSESLLFLFYDMLNCCLPHPPRINACMHVRRSHERLFLWLRAENALHNL